MDTQRRWISYDTFKLFIALVLLVLVLILVLQKPSGMPATSTSPENQVAVVPSTQTPLSPTHTIALPTHTPAVPASLTPTLVLPTSTLPPPATTTATLAPPTPTLTPAAQPAPTETSQPQAASGDCPLAQPSQLAVGKQALVAADLNLREEAGIDKQIVRVNLANSKVEVIGGPICTPYQNGAYLWWNVKSADGVTGWSAEAFLSTKIYFLQPIP